MTENEAIEELKCYTSQSGTSHPEEIEIAIKALEEVQQYRKIGTPEECRAAVEKQTAKKIEIWADGSEHCPCCDKDISCLGIKVCIECGQLLDLGVEE